MDFNQFNVHVYTYIMCFIFIEKNVQLNQKYDRLKISKYHLHKTNLDNKCKCNFALHAFGTFFFLHIKCKHILFNKFKENN